MALPRLFVTDLGAAFTLWTDRKDSLMGRGLLTETGHSLDEASTALECRTFYNVDTTHECQYRLGPED